MLASFIALSLAFSPSDLDLSPRRSLEFLPPEAVSTKPPAAADGWQTAPMVSAEGRTVRLLTNDQLDRIRAIDEELAAFTVLPSRLIGVLGGIAASSPFIFAAGFAVWFVVELATFSAATLAFSFLTFSFAFVGGLMVVPVWGWVIAAVGLGVAIGASIVTTNLEHHAHALRAERRAIIDSTKPAAVEASLVTVGTF